jgi:hypothetical protein
VQPLPGERRFSSALGNRVQAETAPITGLVQYPWKGHTQIIICYVICALPTRRL